MTAEKLIKKIGEYEAKLLYRGASGIEVSPPEVLAKSIVTIRLLLVQLIDVVADAEKDYRKTKAVRFDKFIKEGMKKSPALDQLDFEDDIIEKKIEVDRLRGYMKYTDGVVSAVQTLIKVQTGIAKSDL